MMKSTQSKKRPASKSITAALKKMTAALARKERELVIEAALDKARTAALKIQKREDMLKVCKVIAQQLAKLGIREIRNVQTAIFYTERGTYMNYEYYAKHDKQVVTETDYTNNRTHKIFAAKMQKGKGETMTSHIKGQKVKEWLAYQKTTNVFIDNYLKTAASLNYYWFSLGPVALGISTYVPLKKEYLELFQRFIKVFELAYRRYLDIEQAEAQAKETRIEAALEKVRSVSLAMHHSSELESVVVTLFDKLHELGLLFDGALIYVFDKEKKDMLLWVASRINPPVKVNLPYDKRIAKNKIIKELWTAVEKQQDLINRRYTGKIKNDYYSFVGKHNAANIPDQVRKLMVAAKSWTASFAAGKNSLLGLDSWADRTITDEEFGIVKRFARAFEQAYTRFLDLQRAEAQARESQIQLALEKVRAKTMAMQKSEELANTASLLFQQVKSLGIKCYSSGFTVWGNNDKDLVSWMCNADGSVNPPFIMPAREYHWHRQQYTSWKNKEDFIIHDFSGSEMKAHYKYLRSFPLLDGAFKKSEAAGVKTPARQVHNVFNFTHGNLLFITIAPAPESHEIFKRFAAVFDQTYTRFLDLKKAEVQAREAQIEVALERVRSRSIGMQKSEELKDVIQVVYEQLVHLNINTEHAGFIMDYKERNDYYTWIADQFGSPSQVTLPYFDCVYYNRFNIAKEIGQDFFTITLNKKEKDKFYKILFNNIPGFPENSKKIIFDQPGFTISTVLLENVALYIENFTGISYTDEENKILIRFGKVFQQTYTRFLDLQKAEAQAREAQIETALERVRSKTMAMQKSDELQEAAALMFQQIQLLNIPSWSCGYNIFKKEDDTGVSWMSNHGQLQPAFQFPLKGISTWIRFKTSKENNENFWIEELQGVELKKHYKYIFSVIGADTIVAQNKKNKLSVPAYQVNHVVNFSHGNLLFITYEKVPEAHDIFIRFAKVFEQTYTRFLDLQKAEAQERESQIQLALERVRARTMAMQSSDELAEVSFLLNKQVIELGIPTRGCAFNIYGEHESTEWFSNLDGTMPAYKTPRENIFLKYYNTGKQDETILIEEYGGEKIKKHYQYMFKAGIFGNDVSAEKIKEITPEFQIDHVAYFKYGYLLFITLVPAPEAHDVFKRFAKEFEQTYTRFLDLQKAELQAREAQIEVGLERVRSRAMAMQSSDELKMLIGTMFTELTKLDLVLTRCVIWVFDPATNDASWWMANAEDADNPVNFLIQYHDYPAYIEFVNAWKKQSVKFIYELRGQDKIQWDEILLTQTELKHLPTVVKNDMRAPESIILSGSFNNFGGIHVASNQHLSSEHFDILLRFAKVFDLTYTRFLDLQKAESSAKEAIKQAALDRIRAEIASMRTVEDLQRITPTIWNELTILGIPFIRCGIFIMDDNKQQIQTYLSTPDGNAIASFHMHYQTSKNVIDIVEHWKQNSTYVNHWSIEEFMSLSNALIQQGNEATREQYMRYLPPDGIHLHFLPFMQGMLYVGNVVALHDDDLDVLHAVADAFSTAYARYEDFNKLEAAKQQVEKTLIDLRQAQQQLIQNEKMASLGELTAGIAHEIQNPLNFVTNFSDVSKELIQEMVEEVEKGNTAEARVIAEDLVQNLEKINQHGQRAAAIVKGMLQHSRSGSGQKELIDINALCDEYLRLAYHGLRAKDKTFNASFKTNFDNSIGKINVNPQDMGRVILNLINNAFYAVNEKARAVVSTPPAAAYEPTVTVTTKRENGHVIIIVEDNGNGIPQNIIDKIFQPFFTTKPTGSGTGLGLSLSYDIITKGYGGTFKVNSKEKQGSQFEISLPV